MSEKVFLESCTRSQSVSVTQRIEVHDVTSMITQTQTVARMSVLMSVCVVYVVLLSLEATLYSTLKTRGLQSHTCSSRTVQQKTVLLSDPLSYM